MKPGENVGEAQERAFEHLTPTTRLVAGDMAVPNVHPKIEELQRRIVAQLERRGDDDEVIHLWCGYLAALLEWGLIGDDSYNAVSALLPRVGGTVLLDLFSHAQPAACRNGIARRRALSCAH